MAHKIRVTLGANFKREAVLINPAISAAEPTISKDNLEGLNETSPSNVIATGETTRQILRKIYG
jgi:hypothetical protein